MSKLKEKKKKKEKNIDLAVLPSHDNMGSKGYEGVSISVKEQKTY